MCTAPCPEVPVVGPSFRGCSPKRRVLLADGATGTNYFDMGLASGEPPEAWLLEHPDKVADLHRRFVEAGSDIVLTNSFGATRFRLKLHGAGRAHPRAQPHRRLHRAQGRGRKRPHRRRRGLDGADRRAVPPLGALTMDAAVAAFTEQARGLAEGGADVAWIETMSAAEELEAAARGAIAAGLPLCLHGELRHGRAHHDGPHARGAGRARVASLDVTPVAYGANCGIGPGDLVASILCDERSRAERLLRRQGQLRHSQMGRRQGASMAARPS